jgi:integrase
MTKAKPVRGIWEREPGSGVWWARYRDAAGKLHREKVGRKSDAIALLEKRRNERRTGAKMPENIRAAALKFNDLADAAETYSRAHHSDSKKYLERMAKIRDEFGERGAESIRPEDIDKWLKANTKTPATANRYRAVMSLAYREGLRNGKVKVNPVPLVRQRRESSGVIRFLLDDEESRLRAYLAEHYPERDPDLSIAVGTGMRQSEQYTLTWGQVDFERKEIRLKKTKNGLARAIPINASVLDAFQALKGDRKLAASAPVFSDGWQRGWWDEATEKVLPDYRWHDNRHTFCSRLAMKGVNLKVIQMLAGHKTITMTARYAHLEDSALRAAVDMLP